MQIVPFNNIWVSCYDNLIFSILTSNDKKNEIYAYMNAYKYEICDNVSGGGNLFKFLNITQYYFNKDKIMSNISNISFCNDMEFFRSVNETIQAGKYLHIGIDLFDWPMNVLCYQKMHWTHYTFVDGYDQKINRYHVIDDESNVYKENWVAPEELYYAAIHQNELSPQAYSFDIKENIDLYQITLERVIKNSKDIVRSIDRLQNFDLYHMSSHDYNAGSHKELNAMMIFVVKNRMMANYYLFEYLIENFSTYKEIFIIIQKQFLELIKKWEYVFFYFNKLFISRYNRNNIREQINTLIRDNLKQEKEAWRLMDNI